MHRILPKKSLPRLPNSFNPNGIAIAIAIGIGIAIGPAVPKFRPSRNEGSSVSVRVSPC